MGNQPSSLPPVIGKTKSKLPKAFLIILGVILGGVGLCVVVAVIGLAIFWGFRSVSSGVMDDSGKSASAFQSEYEYKGWKNAIVNYARNPESFVEKKKDLSGEKVGFFTKLWVLPGDSAVESFLKKRLPEGLKIKNLEAISYEKNDDEITIHYQLELKSKEPLYAVNVASYLLTDGKDAQVRKMARYLVLAPDLPSGFTYLQNSQKEIVSKGKTISWIWTVNRAEKVDGKWHIMEAEPIPFVSNIRLENKLLQENPSPVLIRTEDDLASASSMQESALQNFAARINMIRQQVAQFRENAYSHVPGRPIDRGGGSGSGTPTKAGIGALSGAAAGAGLGAAAGGGDGAAIGAGAGAVAGAIGGFLWGRSDEEDELASKRAARARAKRAAEKKVAAYENQLFQEFEQELAFKAKEHDAVLAQGEK